MMRAGHMGAMLLLAAIPQAAFAQDTAPPAATDGKQIFAPDFFTRFSPVSALDMVQRIPSFSIDAGDGRRGFGENAGNVLIDGDRPSTKSDDIFTILGRIAASEVERIELIEQAGADGETQGKGQVVNVIRNAGQKLTGTYEANVAVGTRYGIVPFGNASATLRRGDSSYSLNVSSYSERINGFGPEDFSTGTGALVERRYYRGEGGYDEASVGGAIKTKVGAAKINANAKLTWNASFDRRAGVYTNAADQVIGLETVRRTGPDDDIAWEVGGDVEFPLADKLTTKAIGLYRSASEQASSSIETDRFGQPLNFFTTRNANRPAEAVLRVQNDWSGLKDHAVQFGAEVAFNRLDARFSAFDVTGGVTTAFPSSDVLVKEVRFEPFLSDVWSISPSWKIEAGAIAEFSRLTLSGDSSARRSFKFLKPRAVATWTVDPQTTFEFRAERQVAQLNFGEFATSVDITTGNQVDAGNADLVPEKNDSVSALVRHKFLERGSIELRGSYEMISDTQDLVPVIIRDAGGAIIAQYDGAGNIGDSKRWNVELAITLPLDWLTKPLGISGMEVKYVGHYHGSRVTDPVTSLPRRMSYRPLWHQEWNFRHDIAGSGIVWGFQVNAQAPSNAYFINQFRSQKDDPQVRAFIEYNKFKYGTLRLSARNITGSPFERDRYNYNGTRASGQLVQIIERHRELDPTVILTLSGKF
jgi:outer membrane receptor protein involved in Fe transport